MSLTALLGSALTAVTNGNPNSLTVKSPYVLAGTWGNPELVPSATWLASGQSKGLFPFKPYTSQSIYKTEHPIRVHFIPSAGDAATYTVTIWFYNPTSNTWTKPNTATTTASIACTGSVIESIENPGYDAIWLELSSISSGTISIYYDPLQAKAA